MKSEIAEFKVQAKRNREKIRELERIVERREMKNESTTYVRNERAESDKGSNGSEKSGAVCEDEQ